MFDTFENFSKKNSNSTTTK